VSIRYVILGFLSETPLTGYDLKKKFSGSELFHWSGNNNQIYRTLVELHEEGLVTIEVQYQENKPPRKVYTITDSGLATLREWIRSLPELPQFRSALLTRLAWAEQVAPQELAVMLAQYEEALRDHLVMLREAARRSRRAALEQHFIDVYELELQWLQAYQKRTER
jgi:PadR family transcriptional regulator, regulatory protein AphA